MRSKAASSFLSSSRLPFNFAVLSFSLQSWQKRWLNWRASKVGLLLQRYREIDMRKKTHRKGTTQKKHKYTRRNPRVVVLCFHLRRSCLVPFSWEVMAVLIHYEKKLFIRFPLFSFQTTFPRNHIDYYYNNGDCVILIVINRFHSHVNHIALLTIFL